MQTIEVTEPNYEHTSTGASVRGLEARMMQTYDCTVEEWSYSASMHLSSEALHAVTCQKTTRIPDTYILDIQGPLCIHTSTES